MSETDTLPYGKKPYRAFISDISSTSSVGQSVIVQRDMDSLTNRLRAEPTHRRFSGSYPTPTVVLSTSGADLDYQFPETSRSNVFTSFDGPESPDELRSPEGQIGRQIRGLRDARQLTYGARLAGRLKFLVQALEEEREAWNESSPESLRKLLLFLQTVPRFSYPTVTITPSATFRAEWNRDTNKHFAANFLPCGQVQFVVFCPDPRHPSRIQRVSGITSWENLMNAVEHYKVHDWAADAGH